MRKENHLKLNIIASLMECRIKENLEDCTCTYPGCEKKGICCECVAYHRGNGQIPGCFFSESAEKSFDRSIKKLVDTQ